MRILIVDDDPFQRRVLRMQLERLGYDVCEVANGELAWSALQQDFMPIIITDWMMPNLDGPGLIRRIRQTEWPGYIYIMLLTARDQRADIVAGLDTGADDYLTKPCDANELRARLAIASRIVNLEAELRAARDTDSLTGLRNRRAIVAAAEIELARARRDKSPLSVALLDVDYFKQVNDHHGHHAGDRALQHIAATIMQVVRPYDLVGRWGGEELLVVLPKTTEVEAASIAERVRAQIAATPLTLESGRQLTFTASLGIASMTPADSHTLEALVQLADAALYQAKAQGRNRVCTNVAHMVR